MNTHLCITSSPKICLVMIVRDEETIIRRCLTSVLPFVDRWLIIDTGSTDNTVDIIERQLASIPGQLVRQPFSNFSLLRTYLIQAAAKSADYMIMLDADEELLCLGERLLPDSQFDVGWIEIQQAGYSVSQPRVFRSGFEVGFQGSVRERIILPASGLQIDLDKSIILHHADGYRSRDSINLQNDIAQLRYELKTKPDSPTRLALARACLEVQQEAEAGRQLQQIIRDDQATVNHKWMAYYMLGLHLKISGQDNAALEAFLSAYDLDPFRAETLYRMAEILGQQQRWQDAQHLTGLAIELLRPRANYFEPTIYAWWARLLHASFCIELEQFEQARNTLQALPPARLDSEAVAYRDKLLGQPGMKASLQTMAKAKNTGFQATPKLSIGMATYDDYDGVYFTIASLLSGHPEVRDQIEIIVLDNHPSGNTAPALKKLCERIDQARYVANEEIRGTAIRTHLFDYALGEVVLCLDCHVVILPGALKQLIDYFDAHPSTPDLLQGPLISDNLDSMLSQMEPRWHAGMFGFWSHKTQGLDIPDEPFEIQVQGMGLYACRRDAWLGYNPRFCGFGGEEGYIHEKFRQQGARVVCLPFLRWMHRFERPSGVPYNPHWADWIRNYLIGFDELGLDTRELEAHYADFIGFETMARARATYQKEKRNPFYFFDAIYCISLDYQTDRWEKTLQQAEKLGFAQRLRKFPAIETPDNHHIGCTLSHRRILQIAKNQRFENVLVLEDDVLFDQITLNQLQASLKELGQKSWDLLYLGAYEWGRQYPLSNDCQSLSEVGVNNDPDTGPTCTHAIAYHHSCFEYLLEKIPGTPEEMRSYRPKSRRAVDQILAHDKQLKRFICVPHIATQPPLINYEPSVFTPILPAKISVDETAGN